MPDTPKLPSPAQLLNELQHSEELKYRTVAAAGLDPHLALLRGWQAGRLRRTYADLLADPRYNAACEFFLNDIYAPRDFSQRDHDLQRIHRFLSRILPPQAIALLTQTVELNSMTDALDERLLEVLVGQLGVTDTISPALYAEAYRICDNYPQRLCQIALIHSTLTQVSEGAHRVVVAAAMKLAKLPAQRAGWVDLYDFLERGRHAVGPLKEMKVFVDTVVRRETSLLDLMYAGNLQGFEQLAGLS